MKTAITARLDALYHYQPFRADYVEDLLLRHRIKFSDPHTFNDPWDCRPQFSKSILDDREAYTRHVVYAVDLMRRWYGIPEEELARRAEILRRDRAFLEARIDEITAAMATAIRDKYRVYCLSGFSDSFLMWAHYTSSHKGVCFGFKTRSEVFCGALEVTYLEKYPVIDFSTEDEMAFMGDTLLTKAEAWRYEREFRLIAKEGESEEFLTVQDGFLSFSPDDVTVVIVGCSMPDADLATLRSIIAQREKAVDLYVARPAPDRYVLVLQRL